VENTPSPLPSPNLRLQVWPFALASALTALILGIIAWPIHAMMMARAAARYSMSGGMWRGPAGAHAPMLVHHAMGPWHLLGIIVVMVWVGVGAAIFAALYNAFAVRKP
jgi:hypothetical protein